VHSFGKASVSGALRFIKTHYAYVKEFAVTAGYAAVKPQGSILKSARTGSAASGADTLSPGKQPGGKTDAVDRAAPARQDCQR